MAEDLVQFLHDRDLQGEVLRYGLDHEVAAADVFQLIGEGDPIECRVSLGGVELASTDRAVEGLLQPLTRRGSKFG